MRASSAAKQIAAFSGKVPAMNSGQQYGIADASFQAAGGQESVT